MENIAFLEAYLLIVQKAKSCNRPEAVKFALEPVSGATLNDTEIPMCSKSL